MNKKNNSEATKKWKKNNPEKVKKQLERYKKKYRKRINEKQKLYGRKKYRKENKVKPEKYRVDENGDKIIRVRIRTKKRGKYTTRFAVLKRDNFTCQSCGRKAPFVVLEIDHKIPKSKGGNWELKNLITSCFECNRGKSDTLL